MSKGFCDLALNTFVNGYYFIQYSPVCKTGLSQNGLEAMCKKDLLWDQSVNIECAQSGPAVHNRGSL